MARFGHRQEALLIALRALNADATALDLHNALDGVFSIASICAALDLMLKHKQVSRRLGEPTEGRGGNARFLYKIAPAGRALLIEADRKRAVLNSLSKIKLSRSG